jgi:hypothetical protein
MSRPARTAPRAGSARRRESRATLASSGDRMKSIVTPVLRRVLALCTVLLACSSGSSATPGSDGSAILDARTEDGRALGSDGSTDTSVVSPPAGADAGGTDAVAPTGNQGSAACGPRDGVCDPARSSSCQYCDASGSPWLCTCAATRTWQCYAGDGPCGIACGDRRCLPGELCQEAYEGTGDGQGGAAGLGTPRYSCRPVPASCAAGRPTCACAAESVPRCSQADVCTCTDGTTAMSLKCVCSNP